MYSALRSASVVGVAQRWAEVWPVATSSHRSGVDGSATSSVRLLDSLAYCSRVLRLAEIVGIQTGRSVLSQVGQGVAESRDLLVMVDAGDELPTNDLGAPHGRQEAGTDELFELARVEALRVAAALAGLGVRAAPVGRVSLVRPRVAVRGSAALAGDDSEQFRAVASVAGALARQP
jgi:hypothetical protein